jgi:thiamine-monophosphate kinase
LGLALRGLATSAIDVSDGLLGDLGHILKLSGVGASVDTDAAVGRVAACAAYASAEELAGSAITSAQWLEWALAGGDDYELLFTAPPSQRAAVMAASEASQTPVTRIGSIGHERGLRLVDGKGQVVPNTYTSFDHFA